MQGCRAQWHRDAETDTRVQGYRDAGIQRCMIDARMQECRDGRLQVCMATGMQECRGAGAQGCRDSGVQWHGGAACWSLLAQGSGAAWGGSVGSTGRLAASRGWQGRVGKQEREPRSSPPPLGESCGSRQEGWEYTQTLWSLPCKSWQDSASS